MDIVLSPAPIGQAIVQTVNARDLHARLNIRGDFSSWIKAQLADMFTAGEDYGVFLKQNENPSAGRPLTEYALTLRCAQHIALMSRTPAGKAMRDYLLDLEQKLLEAPRPVAALPVEHEGALPELLSAARGMAAAKAGYSVAAEAMRVAQRELEYQTVRFETASSWYVAAVGRNLSRAIAAPEACIGLQPLKLGA
jgi:phage anti-repressor protein